MDGERESGKASHSYTPSLPYILVSAFFFFSSGPDHFQEMVSFFFPFFFFFFYVSHSYSSSFYSPFSSSQSPPRALLIPSVDGGCYGDRHTHTYIHTYTHWQQPRPPAQYICFPKCPALRKWKDFGVVQPPSLLYIAFSSRCPSPRHPVRVLSNKTGGVPSPQKTERSWAAAFVKK